MNIARGRSPISARRRILLAATAAAVCFPSAAHAAFPTEGSGLESDGRELVSSFTPDGSAVAVYVARSGAQVGTMVALPTRLQGGQYQWFPAGVVAGRVMLAGSDPDRGSGLNQTANDRLALVDPRTGSFRWLCAPADTALADNECLRAVDGEYPTVLEAGRRWMLVLLGTTRRLTLLRYDLTDKGLRQRTLTARERRRLDRDVPLRLRESPLDLDGKRVMLDISSGYRRSVFSTTRGRFGTTTFREGSRIVLARSKDRRSGTMTFFPAPLTGATPVRFGTRGMCASTGPRVVLWDRRSRRTWLRAMPPGLDAGAGLVCAGASIIAFGGADFNALRDRPGSGPIGPVWRWPTAEDAAGWKPGRTLRPGRTLTYRDG